jgi:hypothetical protein
MTDFRALCAELADALDNAIRVVHGADGTQNIGTAYPVLDRARDALAEQRPQPIPVSERLPKAEDCDAEGRCWFLDTDGGRIKWLLCDASEGWITWLPAHALPLPSGEVE